MKKALRWSLLISLCAACTPPPTSGKKDGGGEEDGGVLPSPFEVSDLEPTARGLRWISVAKGAQDKLGVAYFHDVNGTDFDVKYVEWQAGVASAPETITRVQHVVGISVAFQGNGQPAVAYLGGGSDGSVKWTQSDAVIAYRQAAGSWSEVIVVREGDEAVAGNPVSDRGFLVGLFPALAFSGTTAFLAYRDGHDGAFPQQDWNGSDLEVASGGPTTFEKRVVHAGGDNKGGFGGHTQIVIANGQPALLSDQIVGSADGYGNNLLFTRRNSNGTWTVAKQVKDIGNTQLGPAFAYDSSVGFAYAVVDRSQDALLYGTSVDGNLWSEFPVFQSGTGGWWPSLAIDPSTHEPSIVYYVCSLRAGVSEGSCPKGEDDLRLASDISGVWRHVRVDSEGGYVPKVQILSGGQRVVVYRSIPDGALKIAVER